MAQRTSEIHLIPDPVDSALLIFFGANNDPEAIPVIPTRRARSFWGRFALLPSIPAGGDDGVG